jgi:membrane peptidoglycan carboxypeptidase
VLQHVVKADEVDPGRPAGAKTGTQQWGDTKDNQDAWTAGFTPDLATSVWIGKANPGPIKDRNGQAISGETMPARLWSDFTRAALAGRPARRFPVVPDVGKRVTFDLGTAPSADPGPSMQSAPRPDTSASDREEAAALAKKKAGLSETPAPSPTATTPPAKVVKRARP